MGILSALFQQVWQRVSGNGVKHDLNVLEEISVCHIPPPLAYTVEQLSLWVYNEFASNPSLSGPQICASLNSKELFVRQPSPITFTGIRKHLHAVVWSHRAEDMAGMAGNAKFLEQYGHRVQICTCTGVKMKNIRLKSAYLCSINKRKDWYLSQSDKFNAQCVNVDDIDNNRTYYSVFTFIPSIEISVCVRGHMKATYDAAHFQGHVIQSYGTIFMVLVYHANLHVLPIVFHGNRVYGFVQSRV